MPNSQSALALIRAVDAALKASRHEYGEMTDKFLGALHDAGFEVVPVRAAVPAPPPKMPMMPWNGIPVTQSPYRDTTGVPAPMSVPSIRTVTGLPVISPAPSVTFATPAAEVA